MSDRLAFSRLVPDLDGGSHFEDIEIALELQNFAPPAHPFCVSSLTPATHCGFLHLARGWFGEMHPSPIRMWIFVLQGEMEFEAANGSLRRIAPGDGLLLEDTAGRGHLSRVIGECSATLAVVRLP